jgi:hypothetical protein
MAKLCMCDRLLTLMRVGEVCGDRRDCAGEDCTGAGPDEGTIRLFAKAGSTPEGVGCCERGWKFGLGGVATVCLVAVTVELGSKLLCCCDRWLDVELDCGAPESAMGTSADEATARGALALAEDDDRTGA